MGFSIYFRGIRGILLKRYFFRDFFGGEICIIWIVYEEELGIIILRRYFLRDYRIICFLSKVMGIFKEKTCNIWIVFGCFLKFRKIINKRYFFKRFL